MIVTCGAEGPHLKTLGTFYVLNHPNLTWVKTNVNDMNSVPSSFKVGYDQLFYFGRVVSNGVTYVGKVEITPNSEFF